MLVCTGNHKRISVAGKESMRRIEYASRYQGFVSQENWLVLGLRLVATKRR